MDVTIEKAVYGLLDDQEKQIDITDNIRKLVADKKYVFKPGNELAGSDPAYGTRKQLRLHFTPNGTSMVKDMHEGDLFDLSTGGFGDSRTGLCS